MNPNEMNSEQIQEEEIVCPTCGMEQAHWKENQGHGFKEAGELFCCKGCANDSGCTCAEPSPEETHAESTDAAFKRR